VHTGNMRERCLVGTTTTVDVYASLFTLYGKLPNLVTQFFVAQNYNFAKESLSGAFYS
jgi:hypothetical protein